MKPHHTIIAATILAAAICAHPVIDGQYKKQLQANAHIEAEAQRFVKRGLSLDYGRKAAREAYYESL
jgi:hypothetical protein